ncbi:MAG: division/cell wall cluster transcriptional repressor MraZ [Nevskiales bacterium]|nr:division/cell wall cluster transcriptional repressor MraZ [Nevskiales bacterium]
MFAGSYLLSIDDKGRLAIPTRFRQQLGDLYGPQIFITRSYETCIEIYPGSVFKQLADQIQEMEGDRRQVDLLKQVFIGNAVETEMDKQGRVLLPQILRRYARLDGRAVLVGQISRFDIWGEELWMQRFGDGAGMADGLAGAFALLKR